MLCAGSEGPSDVVRMCLVFQLSIEQAQTVAEQVEMKAKVVQSEVKAVTARHKKALEERECELLWKVVLAPSPVLPPSPPRLLWGRGRPTRVPAVDSQTPALGYKQHLVVSLRDCWQKGVGVIPGALGVLSKHRNGKKPFQK